MFHKGGVGTEMEELLKIATGGQEPQFAQCETSPSEEVSRLLPLELARHQNAQGSPIWSPPKKLSECVQDLLSFCGVASHRAEKIVNQMVMENLRTDQLPKLPVSVLRDFGLNLSEAIDFLLHARWIDEAADLEVALLLKANAKESERMEHPYSRGSPMIVPSFNVSDFGGKVKRDEKEKEVQRRLYEHIQGSKLNL